MKRYSLGFVFTSSFKKILLIHKEKPDWQKGKINGIGGKIEKNETALSCIVRELKEETGLTTKKGEWVYVANLSSDYFFTEVFACVYLGNIRDAKSLEQEQIEWFKTNHLPANIMDNLSWLIPLSIDKLKDDKPASVNIIY